ncbi:MAG: acylneuraminate cytidylyltransferase family protein [Kiritimatiellae bacterium]|nr:acylneuraminate cytidylyltransferase family protein [Kiritimatiellia bacterium]
MRTSAVTQAAAGRRRPAASRAMRAKHQRPNVPRVLAVITARGGSRGIPGKNIARLYGKPLIAWSIEAAQKSHRITRLIVSTDDRKIARVARRYGVEVPFLRPASLAQDDSPHIPVLIHALEWVEARVGVRYDYILLLQPTSPFRTATDIDAAIVIAERSCADAVIGVCESPVHPVLLRDVGQDGILRAVVRQPRGYVPRQRRKPVYAINGAIYLVKRNVLLNKRTLFPKRSIAHIMPVERSLDIDDAGDLRMAKLIARESHERDRA